MVFAAYGRLIRAGFVLAREGAFSLIDTTHLPAPARAGLWCVRLVERGAVRKTGRVERLTRALNRLGPTYVKFGQTLATRPDIVGPDIASDLSALQDRMAPFPGEKVPGILRAALGERARDIVEISEPIAAASIAQVHKAQLRHKDGSLETVAIKILRPGVRDRFRRDLESYYAAARLAERVIPPLRRLAPVDVVTMLDHSSRLELDLRFEAASISEFAENIIEDDGFALPTLHWDYGAQNVLTTSWIEGIPIRENAALDAAGVDRKKLAAHLMQSFLRHAIRDGFFHADMHPGNLFADPESHGVIAVDFGIMGRIGPKERRFLADVLYGFITRNYRMLAERHFDIGYVPADQSIDDFALALRAIGEPLQGRLASDISMAKVLGQLFAVTDLFNMRARPELVLLQKTMVLVEGVARALDPDLDIWKVSEPVVGDWIRRQQGPVGRLEEAGEHLRTIARTLGQMPDLVNRANAALKDFEQMQAERRANRVNWLAIGGVLLFAAVVITIVWRLT